MVGSSGIGAVAALWGFWLLLCIGGARGDLRVRGVSVFIGLWLLGRVGLQSVFFGLLFAPYVAVLDIALVLTIFRGDVYLG